MYTSPNALTWAELTSNSAISTTTITAPIAGVTIGAAQTMTILVANVAVVPGMIIKNATGTITYGTVTTVTSSMLLTIF